VKKDLGIALAAILVILGATFALARVRPDLPLTPSQPYVEKGESSPARAAAVKTGKVVMRVNGEPVTEAEFNAFAANVPEEQRAFLASNPQGRRMLANEIAKLKLLEQEAQRLGVSNDPEVRTQLDMTEAQIVAMRALEKLVKPRMEALVQQEFEKEKNGTIELRHIVVAYAGGQLPARDGRQRPIAEAMQKAAAISAKLRGGGADFAALARAESDDQQSAANGGSLGATRPEMLPPEIRSIVANLQPGQISEPFRTTYGVHIFRIEHPSLESLRPQLQRRAQQQAMEEALANLQKQAKVDLDPSFFPPAPPQRMPPPGAATNTNG
jgi:parvulin-like peptidyl-prolyl isomerase